MKKLICGLAVCSFALVLSGCGKADKLTCTMDNEFMPMEMVMTFDGDKVSKVESVMIFEDEETAKAMYEVAKLSGIILSKMDSTSKGGIVLAIKDMFNIPVKFIGLGEGLDDLRIFDLEKFIHGLLHSFNDLV